MLKDAIQYHRDMMQVRTMKKFYCQDHTKECL